MLWQYKLDDETTHAYKDVVVSGTHDNPRITWIKNPTFKYGHLIKDYDGVFPHEFKGCKKGRKTHSAHSL